MDVYKAIRELYAEKQKLDLIITALEQIESAQHGVADLPYQRRGRKSMGAGERQEVSERMKKYWSNHRQSPKTPAGASKGQTNKSKN
jgi:hypothetical protein